jgi:protein required for attachment to host cells
MVMHWVVVGDGAGAKVYESDALLEELTLVDTVHVNHGHVTHGDGSATRPLPGAGAGAHEAQHDSGRETEEKFARALAQLVNEGDTRHKFERIILVAPPRFLGDVRGALSGTASKKLVASIHHDWTKLGLRELSAHIRKNLPESAGR